MGPSKRDSEGDLTQKGRGPPDGNIGKWGQREKVTQLAQKMERTPQAREHKRPFEAGKGKDTDPPEPPEAANTQWDFISDLWYPELQENKFVLF